MDAPADDAVRRGSRWVAPLLSLVWLAVGGLCLHVAAGRVPGPGARPVSVLVLVVLFGAAQSTVVNIQVGREARSIFLSEIPAVLALLSLSPGTFVAARTAGALLGFGLLRRQYRRPDKLLFNTTLATAEAGVALLGYAALTGAHSPRVLVWAAAVAGVSLASSATALGVGVVIALTDGASDLREMVRTSLGALVMAVPVAAAGTVGWAAWEDEPWAAVPLAVVSGMVLLGYRSYAELRERHLSLERLYRFNQVMSAAPGVHDALGDVLGQAREILHAERARITLVPGTAGGSVELELGGDGVVHRGEARYLPEGDPLLAELLAGTPLLVPRTARDARRRAWLLDRGVRDSVMVPLPGAAGPLGVLAVDDRLGDARGFGPQDVLVLETVAASAAVALRNGELLDRLRHESLHDPLTGLPNRVWLQRELDARLSAVPPAGFAIGILDLDSFKEVNDTLGHLEGDRLLCEVARRLSSALDGHALVARLGGDEYAVLADGCVGAAAAQALARRLHRCLEEPVLLAGIDVDVSGSLGLALAPEHGSTAGALLKRADQAMYDAKSSGLDLRVFDPTLDTSSLSKLALVSELRQAVEAGEVEVHVQPKVDAATGRLCGSEALARWSTAARGSIPPSDFVPLAERSGLIRPLTHLVLDRALAACAGWQAVAPGVGTSVNISVRSLADDSLVRLVTRLLTRHGLPARLLTLEITESHIMADPASALAVLTALRDAGVRLSVDDFGTGYSSLSYLRRLPVHEVKIDRSFVHRMVEEPDDAAIVRSIVELARTLNLDVVAEGVEDRRTWDALVALGVDEIQGWVVAKAMPVPAFGAWAARDAPSAARLAVG